jgi:mannose-6-phosphate isomerase-like protein (cupin superfamily)
MRNVLLLSFIFAGALTLAAQTPSTGTTPAKQAPATGTAAPAKPAPATGTAAATKPAPVATTAAPAKPAQTTDAAAPAKQTPTTGTGTQKPRATSGTRATVPAAAGRSGVALRVTDMSGRMLPGVLVELSGPTMRQDETNDGGQVGFSQLQAGTYRLRFSGDAVTTFEREVTLTSGKSTPLDISLSPAPPPREIIKEVAAPPPPEPTPVVGPLGDPQLLSLYDLAEKEIESKAPRREVLVACSGNLRTSMVTLIREEQPKRMYQGAEVSYYVLGGEAAVNVNGKETNLPPGGYVAVPRGTPFSITAKGKKALSLLSVLSGEPCEQAK